jgi:MFS superfamily sulfate permease-like transporter
VNVDAGSKSPMSNFLGATVVLVFVLIFGNLLKYLPRTTLSAIVMVAAVNLIKLEELKFAWKNSDPLKIEVLIWVITFVFSLVFRIEVGLAVGICCNVLYNLLKTSFPRFTKEVSYQIVSDKDSKPTTEQVIKLTWTSSLIYTNCEGFRRLLEKEAERLKAANDIELAAPTRESKIRVDIDASGISDIDSAAIHVLNALSADFELKFLNPSTRISRALKRTNVALAYTNSVETH